MGALSRRKGPDRRKSDNVIQQFYKMPPKKQRYSFTESDSRYGANAHFQHSHRGQHDLGPLPRRHEEHGARSLPPLVPLIGGALTPLRSADDVNVGDVAPKWTASKSAQISRKTMPKKAHRTLMATSFSSSNLPIHCTESTKSRRPQKKRKQKRPRIPSAIHTAPSQCAPVAAEAMSRGPEFDGDRRKIPTPFPGPLTLCNLQKHQTTMSLAGLRVNSSKTDDSEMEMDHVMARGITPPPAPPPDEAAGSMGNVAEHGRNETYDAFLSGLGAEIQRQQQREWRLEVPDRGPPRTDSDCHSVGGGADNGFTLRINSVDVDRIEDLKGQSLGARARRSQSMPRRSRLSDRGPPSGYLHAFDLPATPPLSSCGGMLSDGSYSRSEQVEIDEISVNEDTMRRNKLMSIHLMTNDGHHGHRGPPDRAEPAQSHSASDRVDAAVHQKPPPPKPAAPSVPSKAAVAAPAQGPPTKVGDVFFNKMLRMTFVVKAAAGSWSRQWFINGMARALRTQDIRFRVHKEEGIAAEYSYVSLLCRCDEFDMKQIKNTFEFTFICGEMEECIAQSVGKPALKLLTASCLSYKHYHSLYPKQFLRWVTTSKPPAQPLQHGKSQRMHYRFRGMDKMSIVEAEYIQLPFAQSQIAPNGTNGDGHIQRAMERRKGTECSLNDGMLTPPDRTILHFMAVAL